MKSTDARRVPADEKKYTVKSIWDSHLEIARMLVLGYTPQKIAEKLNISEQTVSNVRNTPVIKEKLDELHAVRDADVIQIKKEVLALVPRALEVISEIMNASYARTTERLRAAISILDKGVPAQIETKNQTLILSQDDIDELNNRFQEALKSKGVKNEEASSCTGCTVVSSAPLSAAG